MSISYSSPLGASMEQNLPKAPQACMSCRKQKRKCNKGLPACSLCERMGRLCDYSDASPAPTSDDFNALRQKLLELERRLNGNSGSNGIDNPAYLPTPSASTVSGAADSVGATPATVYLQQDPAYQNVQNRFPGIAFLDSEAFRYGQIVVPKPSVDIPVIWTSPGISDNFESLQYIVFLSQLSTHPILEVLELLGDGSAVQAVISDYFDTVHTWMSIISKKRMTRNMLNPLWEAGPDLALLFLCMKLMITRPQEGLESAHHPIYTAARRFLALMESSGMTSLLVLQAQILVALYEIGQAIYPAAWMSAGACVRYGLLLGLHGHESAAPLLPRPSTWTEIEERKRTWWAVVIIDRVVSIGGKGRFLACEDPGVSTHLPVDTTAWDEGEMVTSPPFIMSSAITEQVDPFARLCQASHYLGKVLRHHLDLSTPETQMFLNASELYLEISALARRITQEAESSSDYLLHVAPMAMCFSSLCTLCDTYACHRPNQSHSPEEATMQVQAIEGLKSVSASIKEFSQQIIARTSHSLDIDKTSPVIMDALYAGAANFAWLVRESGAEDCQIALESVRHCLRRLGGRWRCAAEYLRILEAQEFTYAVAGA